MKKRHEGLLNEFWYRFSRNRLAVAGSLLVLLLFVVSFLAPFSPLTIPAPST